MTHRGIAASVAFVTGHREGGDLTALDDLAKSVDTLVVLMPAELDAIAVRLSALLGPDRPAALVSQATTAHQQVVRADREHRGGGASSPPRATFHPCGR